ncbi:MAG: S1 RNA-binding domain-containing protein, partial [bacterium]|nr:S1 RNA-binding domain-containing protein [bacterium]
DLGSGRVGVIGSRHWTGGLDVDLTGEVQVGDIVEAAVLVREDHKQRIVLSRSWGRQQRAWDLATDARKTGRIISGTVTDAVAAGLTVDIGIRAFVPASMAGDDDLESLVGTEVECKVTEVNQLKGRCILSRKAALRTRERQSARKRLSELAPGTKVRVRITKVEDFGALVLAEGGLRGRIRRSELSWFRVRRPSDVVTVGDEVEAVVVHTAPAKMNLDLSLRIGDDPLKAIRRGERHQATIDSLAPFGAFVTVGDGIRGLVPTAELAEHPIRHPREVVVPGDSVLAEVTKVDRQRRDLEFSVNLAVLVRPADQP